jgi:hypothetical protein
MPALSIGAQTASVSSIQVARMADRMWRLHPLARRAAYAERARSRLNAGQRRRADVAVVLALAVPVSGGRVGST